AEVLLPQSAPSTRASKARLWNCSATKVALQGRNAPKVVKPIRGGQISSCSHTGGCRVNSVNSSPKQPIAPTISRMKTTGPSPESARDRSAAQASQLSLTLRKPENNGPSPQAGQRHLSPAA